MQNHSASYLNAFQIATERIVRMIGAAASVGAHGHAFETDEHYPGFIAAARAGLPEKTKSVAFVAATFGKINGLKAAERVRRHLRFADDADLKRFSRRFLAAQHREDSVQQFRRRRIGLGRICKGAGEKDEKATDPRLHGKALRGGFAVLDELVLPTMRRRVISLSHVPPWRG